MSPAAGVALMMNNYFHDVATALLLASAVALWVMLRRYEAGGGGVDAGRYFLAIHRSMTRLARFSLAWIVLGGIPRTIFYTRFEWANAAGRAQVPALVVKHVLVVGFVIAGGLLWVKLRRKAREVERQVGAGGALAEPARRRPA